MSIPTQDKSASIAQLPGSFCYFLPSLSSFRVLILEPPQVCFPGHSSTHVLTFIWIPANSLEPQAAFLCLLPSLLVVGFSGNRIWVLCKSSTCSQLLTHLSSLFLVFESYYACRLTTNVPSSYLSFPSVVQPVSVHFHKELCKAPGQGVLAAWRGLGQEPSAFLVPQSRCDLV